MIPDSAYWHRALCPVTPQLVLTGDLASDRDEARRQLAGWSAYGVSHIVDLRSEDDDEWFVNLYAPEMNYLWLGVEDDGLARDDDWFDTGVDHILDAWRDDEARVLVHCQMGMNRGPSMGYAAMLATGWDPVKALLTIRKARPIATTAYAIDAVTWWLTRNGAPTDQIITETERVRHYLDIDPAYLELIIDELDDTEVL